MYFDYLIMAFVGYGIIDAFLGYGDDSALLEDEDAVPEPEIDPDGGDLLDPDTGDSEPDPDYVSGATTINITTGGETSTTTFEDVDFGIAPTTVGTNEDNQIVASNDTGLEFNIDAGAGDDTVSFGFGASVDGGEGADILELAVTGNALASNSEAGTIDLADSDDSLIVNFEDDTPEFVHAVRGQTITVVDGVTIQTDWIDYYVSDNADLDVDNLGDDTLYDADDATRVFRAIIGEGTDDFPADINENPDITFNRTITGTVDTIDI
jgi:hypothetical protein